MFIFLVVEHEAITIYVPVAQDEVIDMVMLALSLQLDNSHSIFLHHTYTQHNKT
jgi:hypothetical protein